ncbi:uncharacterized protein MONBRDRAFT_7918 [Monosiga brevicollis MX1]|uniref:Uncharacterized protein n=1 Tax=Monosiga brevicollis TaxID=81824 RepID=A9UYH0_MONBE|nr:uncharacterized protein MONBRDRAFT_7918 [Monosiga brevicollis MX1]EDQ89460.1 predicted protein [Monosiga brevicollis MX1]|eukprot:XP_001745489.1 hypothetical protein [Monosiga brevicollis MX1]
MPPKRSRNKKGRRRGDASSDEEEAEVELGGTKAPAAAAAPAAAKGRRGKGAGGRKAASGFTTADVDPRQIRFAHARIKPMFSGCGRTLAQTLEELRDGTTKVTDIPTVTVMVRPDDDPTLPAWYYSLNNRRLYVFKQLREEGILDTIPVRVRGMKPHEVARYTPDNCALQAKFLFKERAAGADGQAEAERGQDEGAGSGEESSDPEPSRQIADSAARLAQDLSL